MIDSPAIYSWVGRWFARGSFGRDATLLLSSTALSRVILLLAMPLLARFYLPADIGNWQLFVSSATILAAVVCWRYEVAIPLPAEEQRSRDLVGLCALLAGGSSLILLALVYMFRKPFAAACGADSIEPFLWCIPLCTLLYGCEQASTFWLIRIGDFRTVGTSRVIRSLVMVGVLLLSAFALDAHFGGLIIGTVISQLIATVYLLVSDKSSGDIWKLGRERLARYRKLVVEYRNYPLYVAPYSFVGQCSKRMVYFLLAAFASSSTVGLFAMAMQLTYVPVTFVTAALNQAFYRRAAAQEDVRKLEPLVLKVVQLQVIIALPCFALLLSHGQYVLPIVLGPDWREASGYVSWLALPSLMLFFTAWLDRLFDTLGRQRLAVGLQLAYDFCSLGTLAFLLASGYSTFVAVASYSLVTAIYNVIWLVITFRLAGFSVYGLWNRLLLAAVLLIVMFLAHGMVALFVNQPVALCIESLFAVALQITTIFLVGGLSDMSTSLRRWKSFWGDKSVPLHSQDSDEHYAVLANELKILFPDQRPKRVLEIGCGNGALFGHLDFDRAELYKGVDFSASMLDGFRQCHPSVELVAASGHSYRDDRQYDLIFSNGVVQYFDRRMLAEHLQHAAAMLLPGGSLICASVPWKSLRGRYIRGGFSGRRTPFLRSMLSYGHSLFRDSMGQWYEWRELEELGRKHGLVATFYGSLHYPYRFHVVFQRPGIKQSTAAAA